MAVTDVEEIRRHAPLFCQELCLCTFPLHIKRRSQGGSVSAGVMPRPGMRGTGSFLDESTANVSLRVMTIDLMMFKICDASTPTPMTP